MLLFCIWWIKIKNNLGRRSWSMPPRKLDWFLRNLANVGRRLKLANIPVHDQSFLVAVWLFSHKRTHRVSVVCRLHHERVILKEMWSSRWTKEHQKFATLSLNIQRHSPGDSTEASRRQLQWILDEANILLLLYNYCTLRLFYPRACCLII